MSQVHKITDFFTMKSLKNMKGKMPKLSNHMQLAGPAHQYFRWDIEERTQVFLLFFFSSFLHALHVLHGETVFLLKKIEDFLSLSQQFSVSSL